MINLLPLLFLLLVSCENTIKESPTEDQTIVYAVPDSPKMDQAFVKARETFKYFWRETSWEYKRMVPTHDLTLVKVGFNQETTSEPLLEFMWIEDIWFDGENVTGVLANAPEKLTTIKLGDSITVPLSDISDWMFAKDGKTYGGFTIQVLRAEMEVADRKAHDEAWGLDFGDFNAIEVVINQKEHPEYLKEHPMSLSSKEELIKFLKEHPDEITQKDDKGYTILHREVIAGNKATVETLIELGAEISAKTNAGKTALDFAQALDWKEIALLLK